MPPRRGTRASSSSRLFDNSSEAGGPLDDVAVNRLNPSMMTVPGSTTASGRGMSPGPAKYSSAYGSPPTILPARQNVARQRYNFSSALSHVVDAVEQDNQNDARERARQDAEQQSRAPSLQPMQPPPLPQPPTEGNQSNGQTIRAARAPSKQPSPDPAPQTAPETGNESAEPAEPVPDQDRDQDDSAVPAPEPATLQTPAPPIFTDAERIFAESQISTPSISRQSVVAKTSNILHSIFSSARRMTSTRDDEEFENVRQAFPRLQFFRPRPDDTGPAEVVAPFAETAAAAAAASVSADAEKATTTTDTTTTTAPSGDVAARVGNVAKSLKSRILTPGPGQRNRRGLFKLAHDTSQDELAANDGIPGSTILSARSLLGRRRPQAQVQVVSQTNANDDCVLDRRERLPSERPERQQRPSQTADVLSSSAKNARSRDAGARPTKAHSKARKAAKFGVFSRITKVSNLFSLAITLIVFGLIALRVFVISTATPELYEGYRVDNRLHWYGSDWRSNLRQLVPSALLHPLGAISDEEFAKMNGIIVSHANEVAQMKHANRLNTANLERINRILPAMVHMELDRNGRPVISQEFWHALKDSIQADRDIFTLIWDKDGSAGVSDLQWTALKRQLQASGFVPADPNTKALSVSDVEGIAAASLSKSWEAWLRANERKVREILHIQAQAAAPSQPQRQAAPDYDQLAGHVIERLSTSQLAKLARQVASSREAKEVLVPRQDFLQMLQSSFVEHRVEIKGEMAALEERVLEVARAAASAVKSSLSSQLADRTAPAERSGAVPTGVDPRGGTNQGSMSKTEIMTLVDQLVRKSISDAQLEAMSRGKIKSNWQTNLINQVNFFSRSSGAVVNPDISSPSFEPAIGSFWSAGTLFRGGRKGGAASGASHRAGGSKADSGSAAGDEARPQPGMPRNSAIFEQWEQDGDCWCAAIPTTRPVTVGIKLGLRVLPQYLVVEHISPSATLDPGAMPKKLDMWVQILDYEQQRSLQDWSSLQFGGDSGGHYYSGGYPPGDAELLDLGFVKVGEYTFDGTGGGSAGSSSVGISGLSGAGAAQVFRVSPELEALEAATDHVVVRAITNHGNKDHTCFYRVRLYGQRVD